MNSVVTTLGDFSEALNHGEAVICTDRGEWYCEGFLIRFVRWLFGWQDSRAIKVAQVFQKFLDDMERKSISLNDVEIEDVFTAAEAVKGRLNYYNNAKVKKTLNNLERRVVALSYRLGESRGGKDCTSSCNDSYFTRLETLLREHRRNQEIYQANELVTSKDVENLKLLSCYPDFCERLIQDKKLLVRCFKWGFRDKNSLEMFIKFASVSEDIIRSHLSPRFGFCPEIVKMNEHDEVTCLFNGQEVSILNKDTVVKFKHGTEMTIRKVFEIFAGKNYNPGQVEVLGPKEGIAHWDPLEVGYIDQEGNVVPIDFSSDGWWKKENGFPILRSMNLEQVSERFNLANLQDGQDVASVMSTRSKARLEVLGCHGYLEVALFNQATGLWDIYDFGKYAKDFPQNWWEEFKFITDTVEARVGVYPDENALINNRERVSVFPQILTDEKSLELMQMIGREILAGKKSRRIFQFACKNCAYWPQRLLEQLLGKQEEEGVMPNIFRMPITEVDSTTFIGWVLSKFSTTWKVIQFAVVWFLELFLGAWRGVTVVDEEGEEHKESLWNSSFHSDHIANIPSLAHEKVLRGELPGNVFALGAY